MLLYVMTIYIHHSNYLKSIRKAKLRSLGGSRKTNFYVVEGCTLFFCETKELWSSYIVRIWFSLFLLPFFNPNTLLIKTNSCCHITEKNQFSVFETKAKKEKLPFQSHHFKLNFQFSYECRKLEEKKTKRTIKLFSCMKIYLLCFFVPTYIH